ncbi:N-rich protein [Trifolium pratense]|uniref:N-rich protein n=1 Tax=Trifolium pratense TaxID=57577 RepID=A0A2K3M2M1_TRIPR|nr:N-rich protein [Trifolium pratense]
MENNQQSFWQFSDQLRVHTSNLANLSLNDSIWGTSYSSSKKPAADQRINFDIKVGGQINNNNNSVSLEKSPVSDFNNHAWNGVVDVGLNGGFNKGIYSKPSYGNFNANNNLNNINFKGNNVVGVGVEDEIFHLPNKSAKKNTNPNKKHGDNNNNNSDGNKNKDSKAASDKRFKTLPPSESLPRNETIGGYIFVCNNDTMAENLKRQLFD